GLQLWARGARAEGAAELEESMFRFPSLASHAYLGPAGQLEPHDAGQLIQALDEGDVLGLRLAALEDAMAEAIGRGLDRALREPPPGDERAAIVEDLATLLEARGRWSEAARALVAEADHGAGSARTPARAARVDAWRRGHGRRPAAAGAGGPGGRAMIGAGAARDLEPIERRLQVHP